MEGEDPLTVSEPESAFAEQAQAAGIVLPKKARAEVWEAVVIVVALIVMSAGIGEVTGWVNLRSGSSNSGGGFETQSCTGSSVQTYGSVSSAIDPAFASWLDASAVQMSQAVGGCFALEVNETSGDGYVPPLGGPHSEFTATYTAPTSSETGQLSTPIVVAPVALGAVAVIYNVPGAPSGLNLTASVLAGIYSGTITSWNSSALASLNPDLHLTGAPTISPMYRTGDSVANQVFTDFLAGASPAWNASVGEGLSVAWPVGAGISSDAAMLTAVSATPGSIGYVELFGPVPSGVDSAQLQDSAGGFAPVNAVSVWVAADSLANSSSVTTGSWANFSLAHAPAPGSYPLAVLSYVGIYRDLGVAYAGALTLANATWLLTFLYWLTGAAAISPLPNAYAGAALQVLDNETYNGATIVHLENENGEGAESGGETGEF
jgi:ABC-type phosphate transport system substrate-binding protein